MEAFLKSYEAGPATTAGLVEESRVVKTELPTCLADEVLSHEQRQTLDRMDTSVPDDADLAAVEELLDTILSSNNSCQAETTAVAATEQPIATDILQAAVDSEGLSDSGYQTLLTDDLPLVSSQTAAAAPAVVPGGSRYSVANVSHCVTPDGQKVIIVVQRPDPVQE